MPIFDKQKKEQDGYVTYPHSDFSFFMLCRSDATFWRPAVLWKRVTTDNFCRSDAPRTLRPPGRIKITDNSRTFFLHPGMRRSPSPPSLLQRHAVAGGNFTQPSGSARAIKRAKLFLWVATLLLFPKPSRQTKKVLSWPESGLQPPGTHSPNLRKKGEWFFTLKKWPASS